MQAVKMCCNRLSWIYSPSSHIPKERSGLFEWDCKRAHPCECRAWCVWGL